MAHVNRLPSGKWRARYRDESGREHSRHFVRKVDAQRWLDEIAASTLTGQYVSPEAGRITFKQFYAEWSPRQLWVSNTRANADLAVSSVPFADVPMNRIRRSDVESWVKAMTVDLAATTIRTRVKIVRSVFIAAVRDRVITHDPAERVVLPRLRRADAAMTIPDPETVGAILADAAPVFRAFVALAALAGMRKGEIAGLQVRDIDFVRRQLHIRRQIQRTADGIEVRLPKYGSERTVFIPDQLVAILNDHIAAHLSADETDGWLFADGSEPWDDNRSTWLWRAARRKANATDVRLHDLRHFYASGLIAAGCDVVTVQRALGHASATTTLGTYSHLWPTAEDKTRAAAADIAAAILSSGSDALVPGSDNGPNRVD